jgi:hypothetical protein
MLHKTLETVAAAALSGMMLAGALLAAPGMAGTPTGHAATWGYNVHGQLGDNSTADAKVPVAVDTTGVLAGKTLTAIGTGFEHSCAVADGAAYCWGENSNGQLGNNTAIGSTVPVAVDTTGVLNGRTVTAIDAGLAHTCAVADGRAYCWGYNGYGELGINSTIGSKVPVAVSTTGPLNGKAVTAISLGGHDTCAVADGTASCWGYNPSGQLGNDTTTDSTVPVPVNTTEVLNGRTVTAISAGSSHTAVLAVAAPKPPNGVIAVAGDGQATISWTPPADDGGSPVLEYVATATPGGATCATSGTTCAVTGLTNGTTYTFTVTARNTIGVSAPSAPSAPVTPTAPAPPVQPPAKVKGVRAKLRKGTVKITWRAAAGATSYGVRISKPGGKTFKAWKTTTKRVFKAKLRKGTKYRFQVAAVGTGGRGPVTTIRFKGK